MRIERIKIHYQDSAEFALQEINLPKLGQVVLVAGKNGSGKSRFLKLLKNKVEEFKSIIDNINELNQELFNSRFGLKSNSDALDHAKVYISKEQNEDTIQSQNMLVDSYTKHIEIYKGQIASIEERIDKLNDVSILGNGNIMPYVPKDLTLKDPNAWNKNDLLNVAKHVSDNGFGNFVNGTLASIQVAQNKYYSVSHSMSQATPEQKDEAIKNYNQLESYIKQILGTELARDVDDNATLFGKPLGKAQFSDGQIVLLQFCVALHTQGASLPDLVLLLDEPENHLHPAALIEVLDRLKSIVTNGQIWIATHSINVLAHFHDATTYYIEEGKLSYAGDTPEKVLEGLLGNEEEREKLANFLALPFEMSSTLFAYESLLGPAVVMTDRDDPQLRQIQSALQQVREVQGAVRVLDYGAGRGRLIAASVENESDKGQESVSWLDYIAYEPYDTYADECKANIERVYGQSKGRYFEDLNALRQQQHDETFDIVLLTNVFHEIPLREWTSVLRGIAQLLKPEGQLIIVEDQRLPHGEMAHEYGFLLFDTIEFRKLFSIQPHEENMYTVQQEREGRLKAHYFKREVLTRVNSESKRAALEELQSSAKQKISQIRSMPRRSFKNGKIHALWMNQYANAQLALESL